MNLLRSPWTSPHIAGCKANLKKTETFCYDPSIPDSDGRKIAVSKPDVCNTYAAALEPIGPRELCGIGKYSLAVYKNGVQVSAIVACPENFHRSSEFMDALTDLHSNGLTEDIGAVLAAF